MSETHTFSTATTTAADLIAVLAFWRQARGYGWEVTVPPDRTDWRAESPDHTASVGYRPADELCNGAVKVHDDERTLTRTGVATAAEAIAVMREFLGWPA